MSVASLNDLSVQVDGRRLLGSRPGRLRLVAIAVVLAIVAAGVFGFVAASEVISNTNRVQDSTGNVLIGTQELFASLAEADAAATAVHLSGVDGDREQRALYERALARSSSSLETVARHVENDDSHENLQGIAEALTRYSGMVEASRIMNEQGMSEADAQLLEAIQLVRGEMTTDVSEVTQRVQTRLNDEIGQGLFYPAMAVYILAVIVLIAAMAYLALRFRRLVNPPLFLAALITIGVATWFGWSYFNQQAALEHARDGGYEAIRITSEIQTRAFRFKADESLSLIAGTFAEGTAGRDALADEIRDRSTGAGLMQQLIDASDSPRERAVAEGLVTRWEAYRAKGDQIGVALSQGQSERAVEIASGTATSSFNGFNTQVESLLGDNQAQFDAEVQNAGEALNYLRWVVVLGAVLAALLAWFGFALRIREYS